MTVTVTHAKISTLPVDQAAKARGEVCPDDWNDDHTLVGIDTIESNIRGVVIVDMDSADYTMTDAEANSALLVITNSGDGTKTLTWPTTSDDTRPAQQTVVTLLTAGDFTIAAQSGGGTASLIAGTIHIVTVTDVLGAFNSDQYIQNEARRATNGLGVAGTGSDFTFAATDAGQMVIGDDSSPQNFNINADISGMPNNAVLYFFQRGSATATLVAGAGVTLYGNLTVATNSGCSIWRDGTTNTWYVV